MTDAEFYDEIRTRLGAIRDTLDHTQDALERATRDLGQAIGFVLGVLQTVHPHLRVNPTPAQAALLERVCGIKLGEDSPIVKPKLVM